MTDKDDEQIPIEYEAEQRNLLHQLLFPSYEVEEEATAPEEAEEYDGDQLMQEEDRLILMHRDAHFSSSFPLMYDYYVQEKKGAVLPDATRRIAQLMQKEQEMKRDLAPLLLTGALAEKVANSKKMYCDLGKLAGSDSPLAPIGAMILSEDDPKKAAQLVVQHPGITAPLLEVLESPVLIDPLFPGYGKAPIASAYALGLLREKQAIPPLFIMLSSDDFELVSACEHALVQIGKPAQEFLMNIIKGKPITNDHERAASALLSFEQTAELSSFFLKEFEQIDAEKYPQLASLYVLGFQKLDTEGRAALLHLEKTKPLPSVVRQEIHLLKKSLL